MPTFDRRRCLKTMLRLAAAVGTSGCWQARLAAQLAATGNNRRLIVLWMPGGPSQLDTWDLKPGHPNGGPFKEIATAVPGMRFSEHLEGMSRWANHLAIIRSMQTREGDHRRGTYLVRTGQRPDQPLQYPSVPAAIAKELSTSGAAVPGYVSILPSAFINPAAFGSGFLGARYQPLTVTRSAQVDSQNDASENQGDPEPVQLRVENLAPPMDLTAPRVRHRRQLWSMLQESYGARQRGGVAAVHDTVYRSAIALAESEVVNAFDLSQEHDDVRRSYGTHAFGQGCLLARRLLEHNVPVVEVALDQSAGGLGWDTHTDNFTTVRQLSRVLDQAWSRLMQDLVDRGLLDTTTIVWMGEFGRTPRINASGGRDHFPNAWSCVLAGGGIQGGAIIGKTSRDGMEVVDRPVTAPELLATVCRAVGVDPATENYTDDQRPIKIVDAPPIAELLA